MLYIELSSCENKGENVQFQVKKYERDILFQ